MSEHDVLRIATLQDVVQHQRTIGIPEWYITRQVYALRELYYAEERLRRQP